MLLANLSSGCGPSDGPEEVVTDPELKQPFGDQDVAGVAAVVLAHADVLGVDTHDAVGRDSTGDPLLSIALRRSSELTRTVLAGSKPALWSRVGKRLVGTLRVVVAHPLIESLLGGLQVPKHLPGFELGTEGAVEALDLARGGRRARLGQDVVDPVLAADPVDGFALADGTAAKALTVEHHRLHFWRHLVRAVGRPRGAVAQAFQPVAFVASQPAVHGLPAHTPFARNLTHRPTVGNNSQHRFVPLLSHAHLPHGRGVSRRYRSSCSKRAEGLSHGYRRRFVA